MADEFKYDVALSVLVQDISLATALSDELRETLKVFFFPRNQEELAGTDRLESIRRLFLKEFRLNVVVFRSPKSRTLSRCNPQWDHFRIQTCIYPKRIY